MIPLGFWCTGSMWAAKGNRDLSILVAQPAERFDSSDPVSYRCPRYDGERSESWQQKPMRDRDPLASFSIQPFRLADRILGFHPGDRSSILLEAISYTKKLSDVAARALTDDTYPLQEFRMPDFGEYRGGPMHANDVSDAPDKVIEVADKRLQELGTVPKIEAPDTTEVEEGELSELEEEEETSTETDEESEETTPEEEDEESEEAVVEKEKEKSATEDEPAIPESLYRAAEHNGLSAEEIADHWKANPELAEKMFDRMRQDTVKMNKQYCELGRARKQASEEYAEQSAATQIPTRPKSYVDINKAREEFGDGAAELISTLDQALVRQAGEIAEIKSTTASPRTQGAAAQDRSMAINTQIGNFFGHDNMRVYDDFYGPSVDANGNPYPDWSHLTPGQEANRSAVTNKAADYQAGVAIRGTEVTVGEALAEAHTIISENVKVETIRKGIIKSVQKKAKGVTLRPTKTKVKPEAPKLKRGEKMTESKVYSTAKARLANMKAGKPMS